MIHISYKYAVGTYIILQMLLLSAFLSTDSPSPRGFIFSSLGLTFTLIAIYFSNKYKQKEKSSEMSGK